MTIKAFKVPRNKPDKWCIRFLWRKQQNLWKGERKKGFTIIMDGRGQCYKAHNFLQIYLWIQYDFNKNLCWVLQRTWQEYAKELQRKKRRRRERGDLFVYWCSLKSPSNSLNNVLLPQRTRALEKKSLRYGSLKYGWDSISCF